MDNTRLFLVVSLSFLSLLLWEQWQSDYSPKPPSATTETASREPREQDLPPDLAPSPQPGTDGMAPPTAPTDEADTDRDAGGFVTVTTDLLELHLGLRGGSIYQASLLDYASDTETPDQPYLLLGRDDTRYFIEQGGLLSDDGAPDHRSIFSAAQSSYDIGDRDSLQVDFRWSNGDGIAVTKRFTFERGSYVVDVSYIVDNEGAAPWRGRFYERLQRANEKSKSRILHTFTGAVISSPETPYKKYDFGDLKDEKIAQEITGGWAAVMEHYFIAALIPPAETPFQYFSDTKMGERYQVGAYSPEVVVAPGDQANMGSRLYIGPKLQHILAAVAPNLDLSVDYGVLWFLAKPLYLCLEALEAFIGNWGWAIVVLTVLIKLMFYPLSAAGYRSMAKMRAMQPRMVSIKERYKDDRTRMNQAMMDLYKNEKINPLGGCLPIIVQIPVFISLYWVLLESVELRHAPFVVWIQDLSARDPLFVLPVIMGISMWFQQKLSPAPMDPIQERVMQILPFAFTIFFAFFPAGLVLYWVVNNILSIAQQWRITQSIEQQEKPRSV